jgi:hypothetical protein
MDADVASYIEKPGKSLSVNGMKLLLQKLRRKSSGLPIALRWIGIRAVRRLFDTSSDSLCDYTVAPTGECSNKIQKL